MLQQPLLFIGCSSIQFFNSQPFSQKYQSDTFGTLPLTVQHLCDLPALGKRRISLGVENFLVSQGCASAHILSLLGTSLIKNSKSISNYVKIINLFTNGEGIKKLEV